MSDSMAGRTALVTGAARGQGRAFAVRLARDGADVIVLDIADAADEDGYPRGSSAELDETVALIEAEGRSAAGFVADIRDRPRLAEIAGVVRERFPRLDVIVANAGVCALAELGGEPDSWDRIVGTNLTGTYNTVRAFVPQMIDAGHGGSIVFTSSVAGLKGLPLFGAYGSTKHALQGLMKVLAQELSLHGIRVNTVNPGPVATGMTEGNPEMLAMFGAEGPMADLFRSAFAPVLALEDNWIQPEAVADAVAWLAADQSRHVTGLAVPVDGGVMVR